jgi:hypothetical protein
MRILRFLIALAGSTTIYSQNAGLPSLATVKLLVVDCYGKRIDKLDLFSFQDSKGRDRKDLFDQGLIAKLPEGVYKIQLSVVAPLEMQYFEASVVVKAPETSFVAGLDFYYPEDVLLTWSVHGRFEVPSPKDEKCVLFGVYIPYRYFAIVQRDGSFSFENVRAGTYTVACGLEAAFPALRTVKVPPAVPEEIVVRRSQDEPNGR